MTSKCPNCKRNFGTVKGMRIHKSTCDKKQKSKFEKDVERGKEALWNSWGFFVKPNDLIKAFQIIVILLVCGYVLIEIIKTLYF